MRIIETSYKAVGAFGSYEVKVMQVKGLRLRVPVPVKRPVAKEAKTDRK